MCDDLEDIVGSILERTSDCWSTISLAWVVICYISFYLVEVVILEDAIYDMWLHLNG